LSSGSGRAPVATFGVTWEAVHERRNKDEVKAFFRDEYGKVLLHARDGSGRTVAEIEVAKALRAAGWAALWTDSFGRAPGWMKPWTRRETLPGGAWAIVSAIRAASPKAKPWDVLAWGADDGVLFVECKAESERFTRSKRRVADRPPTTRVGRQPLASCSARRHARAGSDRAARNRVLLRGRTGRSG
jgi:hypothetical protein